MDKDITLVASSPDGRNKRKGFKSPFRSPFNGTTKKVQKKSINRKYSGESNNTLEDIQLSKSLKLLYNELTRQIRSYEKENANLKDAIKIATSYNKELETIQLCEKWRNICQGATSYLYNSTLFKIDKLGGYEEFIRKEVESEKKQMEYQLEDNLQVEIDNFLDSEEFQALSEDEQDEFKRKIKEQTEEVAKQKEKVLESLERKILGASGKEMTMKELALRLKIDYDFIFPP